MKGSRHGLRSLINGNGAPLTGTICTQCRNHLLQTRYASTATAINPSASTSASLSSPPPPQTSPTASPKLAYHLRASVVLSRPPLITRDLTAFEKAFYLYQRRLNERTALNPMQYFYFRAGSPAMLEYKKKRKQRRGIAARDIGDWNPYDRTSGWHDEVVLGSEQEKVAEVEWQARELIRDSLPLPKEDEEEMEMGMGEVQQQEEGTSEHELVPRVTEADREGDVRSLDRLLQRTLYLVVQNAEGKWIFPEDGLAGRESLAMAAQRILTQSSGPNMNTWIVGNHPVGYRGLTYPKALTDAKTKRSTLGEKSFFMKARIMAGQADLKDNSFGLKDFKWLSREEVKEQVGWEYWNSVRGMLAAR